MDRSSAVKNSSTCVDPHHKSIDLSQEESSEHGEVIFSLCESFKVKLSIKNDGQATLTDPVSRKDNCVINPAKVPALINSANQCGQDTKLVDKFSHLTCKESIAEMRKHKDDAIGAHNSLTSKESTAEMRKHRNNANGVQNGLTSKESITEMRKHKDDANGAHNGQTSKESTAEMRKNKDDANGAHNGQTSKESAAEMRTYKDDASGAYNSLTNMELTAEMRKLKDDEADPGDNKLCEGTQPRDDSGDVIAENINLPAFDGELNLKSINYHLRRLLEQVESIQKISKNHLQHTIFLKAFHVLLNFKDIALSGLLHKGMLNYGLENDIIPRMIGVLLQSLNFLVSDFKDKLIKFEKTQLDSTLQDPSGKVCEYQDPSQLQTDPEVPVNYSGDTQSTTGIGVTKDDTDSTSKKSVLETKDVLSQTDSNCETCTQCGKDPVTVEKKKEETYTTSFSLDTNQNVENGNEKGDQRVESKVEVKNLQVPRRIISQTKRVTKNEKVLLLLGASDCGKTTLVKLIACFYAGIKSPDEFLLDDIRCRIENLVQHSSVTAFTAYPENPNDPAITIIDTPGFNDSSGDLIQSHIDDLQRFLTDAVSQGLEINAIGFVIQAHVARLTPSEKLVMDYVKRHFKKCSAHIIPMITFADSQKDPPVLKAMKEFKINIGSHFLFNNSVLTFDDNEEISDMDRLCWKRGFKCWRNICKLLLSLSAVKISHIHSRQSSVAESTKSEKKITGLQSKNTKETYVQTDIKNSLLKEQERQDQSTNTEVDACKTKFQKSFSVNNTEREKSEATNKAIDAFRHTIIRFAALVDNYCCSRSGDWKTVREEIWEMAATAYQFVDIDIPCDIWVYSIVTEILLNIQTLSTVQVYLCALALSETKPLVHVGYAIIYNLREEYNGIHMYGANHYIWRGYFNDLKKVAIANAMKTLQHTLARYNVQELMNTQDFLRNLLYEVDESLGMFIKGVLLKN